MFNFSSSVKILFSHLFISAGAGPPDVNEPPKIDLSKNAEFRAVKIPQLVPSF
jgi:hypothetical protein